MRDSRPQQLNQLFDETNLLRNIQQQAVVLVKLNQTVKSLLPAQLQPHCRVANYRKSILVLETTNANWLMRLRYEQSNLLSTLRATILPSLSSIDIKVSPVFAAKDNNLLLKSTNKKSNDPPVLRHLSQESAKQLQELALHCPDRLRIKLERLASLAGESAKSTSREDNSKK